MLVEKGANVDVVVGGVTPLQYFIAQGNPHPMTDSMGADPLSPEFTFTEFDALLGARKAPLKSLLLRQDLIAGIGNYYVQDMLFLARVHPMRPVASLGAGDRLPSRSRLQYRCAVPVRFRRRRAQLERRL